MEFIQFFSNFIAYTSFLFSSSYFSVKFLALVLLLTSVKGEIHCSCGMEGRIVGGVQAEENEFPWNIGIVEKSSNTPYCGGVLVNHEYVITAAHCFMEHKCSNSEIVVGGHDLKFPSKLTKRIGILKCLAHPGFNNDGWFYDFNLIQLAKNVSFDKAKQPGCFPKARSNYDEKNAMVIGWGLLKEEGLPSNFLRKTELTIIPNSECKKYHGKDLIYHTMICAMWRKGGRDACEGDSGGPLMIKHRSQWYVVGVVSWGVGCSRPNKPGVYTRIDKFYQWLEENINSKFCYGYSID